MAQAGNVIGKVVVLQGEVSVKGADGVIHTLKLGDLVHEGEVIITGPGGRVELGFDDGRTYLV
ncbi:MAG: hypothetical protein EG825_09295, partial [Rhodocyclaceae bacterium]|nr:hypothetical protein [Rhodocyclaceae bacterium]